ncbi:MAG: filamentous hemagglutinin N-terminal domain-containing protein, partial [Pseudomonadota bacterium]|nr:filamentous hemagglutinin N-terminal domain-containing protein [Pseudomonadota bacterium]
MSALPRALSVSIRSALLCAGTAAVVPGAQAAPAGGSVVAGQGSIGTPVVGTTVVNQQTQALVVNWQSFDVAAGELVRFDQPTASATALNRILDHKASQVHGAIEANGRVFLVNTRGIFFGKTAQVNVGSLVASGLDITTEDFMAGRYEFDAAAGSGSVINEGTITAATGGSVSLLGSGVSNSGLIVARYGRINLGSGQTATLDFDGDGLIRFAVDGEVLGSGDGIEAAVDNSGTIQAHGGQVLLQGAAAKDVFTQVVNNSGVIGAQGIDTSGGSIRLVGGGSGGTVLNTGSLDASSLVAEGGFVELSASDMAVVAESGSIDVSSGAATGGEARVLGDNAGLFDTASVNASGATGGGTVLVGGDFQGGNPEISNATYAVVASDAEILADATGA